MQIRNILRAIILVVLSLLITLPSVVYGVIPYFLMPVAWFVCLLIHRPVFSLTAGIIALKLSTVVLLVIIPSVLYYFDNKTLALIYFSWIGVYLLIRIYSGVHAREVVFIKNWKQLDAYGLTQTKYNSVVTIVMLVLTALPLVFGDYFNSKGLFWVIVMLAAIAWCISPFEKK